MEPALLWLGKLKDAYKPILRAFCANSRALDLAKSATQTRKIRDLTHVLNPSIRGSKILPSRFISLEVAMPHYEFLCRDCKKAFSETLTIVRHEKEKIACPHCGSKNVEQRWSAFSAITSKKSA